MLSSLNVSYRLKGKNEKIDYHSHPEYEIYFFHAGTCKYLIHNQIYDLKPGDIIVMDGLTLHRPNISSNEPYIRSVIHFSPHIIRNVLKTLNSEYLLDIFEQLPHYFIRTKENRLAKKLEEVIHNIVETIQEPNNEQTKETQLKILLIQALIIVHKLSKKKHLNFTKEKSFQHEHIENIATFIQNNYKEKLTLDTISDALNLSKSYMSRLFKETTGLTIMEYLMECRLKQAKYLLETKPKKPIKQIAYKSGFESASHFSRYFRAKVGKTARDYRKNRLRMFQKH